MKTLEEFLDMMNEKIEAEPESKQEKVRKMYNDWLDIYEMARQLCYGKVVMQNILNARNLVHTENILIDARRKCS